MSRISKKNNAIYDVHETPPINKLIPLSFQHLFAMFGSTVLVPILTGFNTSVALICSGIGTLIYILVTKGKIPVYLGSSFAFITPLIVASKMFGKESAGIGVLYVAITYIILSGVMKLIGKSWIKKLLPPIVVGPVIMVIGLGLAKVAVNMATTIDGAGGAYSISYTMLALGTLSVAIISSLILGGFFRIIPILVAIFVGYIASYMMGLVNLTSVEQAPWFAIPEFNIPTAKTFDNFFSLGMLLTFAPISLVTITEHIGDQTVVSKIIGRSTLINPGIHRSILGDGLGMICAGLLGGPPLTTYGENTGVITITRVYSVVVIAVAAILAIVFGFINKVEALIHTIPTPVMGGISILLFGLISSSGLRVLAESKINISETRNLIIASSILVLGIGGASIQLPHLEISGMGLAAFVGIILHLVLPNKKVSEVE